MRKLVVLTSAAFLFAAGLSTTLKAQAPADDPTKMEPAAVNALNEMGAYLRTLKDFQVQSTGTSEIVLTDGQKVQLAQTTNLIAKRPDRLMADVVSDQGAKLYVYDGKTFSILSRDDNYYATVPAPGTLLEVANVLDDKYNIELPLVDLFLWGSPGATAPKLTSAIDIGSSDVGGITCEHYAYRQEGLDWQVWIQKGSHPLPKKMVLTTTTDEARPQHTSVLTWNLAPSYNEATFAFEPPPDAHKISFASALPKKQKKETF